jgi:hypothetical protein
LKNCELVGGLAVVAGTNKVRVILDCEIGTVVD